jgi:hypothetical protein
MTTKPKVIIVTTTINPPTAATLKFAKIAKERNFLLVIVGDTKTPHEMYRKLEFEFCGHVKYLSPDEQDELYPALSNCIGWKTIQRRNIGFVYAYKRGAPIIATVDDDNIPYDNWGENILVGQDVVFDEYENQRCPYFDPLSITADNHVWHRGYPIEHLRDRHANEYRGKATKKCLVQAMLWDGDPDIDAMARLTFKPCVKYSDITGPFGSRQIAPFNSQNTFLAREVISYYAVLPFTGRMDDIWGSYILQSYFPDCVVYDVATVYQDRNVQDLITNLEKEIIGYRNTLNIIKSGSDFFNLLPTETQMFWLQYQKELLS